AERYWSKSRQVDRFSTALHRQCQFVLAARPLGTKRVFEIAKSFDRMVLPFEGEIAQADDNISGLEAPGGSSRSRFHGSDDGAVGRPFVNRETCSGLIAFRDKGEARRAGERKMNLPGRLLAGHAAVAAAVQKAAQPAQAHANRQGRRH